MIILRLKEMEKEKGERKERGGDSKGDTFSRNINQWETSEARVTSNSGKNGWFCRSLIFPEMARIISLPYLLFIKVMCPSCDWSANSWIAPMWPSSVYLLSLRSIKGGGVGTEIRTKRICQFINTELTDFIIEQNIYPKWKQVASKVVAKL